MMASWHISFGQRDPHLRELQRLSRTKEGDSWTITSAAKPGDLVAFYFKLPDSAVLAVGTAITFPKKQDRGPWRGQYLARVAGIRMLRQPVRLQTLRRCFPTWGWPRLPRRSTTVPSSLVTSFAKLLRTVPLPGSVTFDLAEREGAPVEYSVTRRGRSRRLRDEAIVLAKGVCTTCRRDFSKVLGGLGACVLQVHHRRQLASWSSPRVTRLRDLAVVCANCHRIIHADPARALRVEELQQMIRGHTTIARRA